MQPTAEPTRQRLKTDDGVLAALSYVLVVLGGMVVFLFSRRDQTYRRWNAIQGVPFTLFIWLQWSIVEGAAEAAVELDQGYTLLNTLPFAAAFALLIFVVVIFAVRAYRGRPVRIPGLARLADRYA